LTSAVVQAQSSVAPGDLLIADYAGDQILDWNPVLNIQPVPVSAMGLHYPSDLVCAGGGNIFIVYRNPAGIIQFNTVTGQSTVVSSGQNLSEPPGITLDQNGQILVACRSPSTGVVRINPLTGNQTVVSSNQFFASPAFIKVALNGDILVSDIGQQAIIRVNPTNGNQSIVSSNQYFVAPADFVVGSDGYLYVANGHTTSRSSPVGVIVVNTSINPASNQTLISSNGFFIDPCGIAFGTNGHLFVSDDGSRYILDVDPQTGNQTVLIRSGLIAPAGLAVVPVGFGAPEVNTQPLSQQTNAGALVTLSVSASGIPPLTYQWLFDGDVVLSATNTTLVVSNFNLADSGSYSVVVSNDLGSVTDLVSVLSLQVLNFSLPTGTNVTLTVGSVSSPLQWYCNGRAMPSATNTTLVLPSFNPEQAGSYSVVMSTSTGSVTDLVAVLALQSQNLLLPTGTNVTLTVGSLPSHFQWYFNGTAIPSATNSTLLIPSLDFAEAGSYSVVASSTNGMLTNLIAVLGVSSSNTVYYYDGNDRLLGMESPRGLSIGYVYDGNGSMVRQAYLSRASEINALPVLWRFLNGLSPTDNTGNNALYADADGNGWSNFAKWLAGVNPLNPQSVPTNAANSSPAAVVVPGTNTLTAQANVPIVMFNVLGNPSIPYLQYEFSGSTTWQNATILSVDGASYSTNVGVAAWPTGSSHVLVWNALGDLGQVQTNIMLRAQAMDVEMLGTNSAPVTYAVNTLPPFQINGGSLQMTPNGFEFSISGANGTGSVVISASTNLIDWTAISTNPTFPFIDPAATNIPWRFYKATEQ
jgi:YD repeat-containing protein